MVALILVVVVLIFADILYRYMPEVGCYSAAGNGACRRLLLTVVEVGDRSI